jgi:putative ATP-dependent exoDNAse, alpha subunit-helicase superfamily I member
MTDFKCKILSQIYYNDNSDWGVYSVSTQENIEGSSYNPFTEEYNVKIVGITGRLNIGCEYQIKGEFEISKQYKSSQYKVMDITPLMPTSRKETEIFLRSILTDNQTNILLEAYPNIVNDIIADSGYTIDYSKTKGIKETTYTKIKDTIIRTFGSKELITMLIPLGITMTMVGKIAKLFPSSKVAKDKVYENPYILTKIKGIGFKKADEIALKLQPSLQNSYFRAISFIEYYLKETGQSAGHTYITFDEMLKVAKNNIPECKEHIINIVNKGDDLLYVDKHNKIIALKYYKDIEQNVYNKLMFLKNSLSKWSDIRQKDINVLQKRLKNIEIEQGFSFTDEQIKGIQTIINNHITCVIGNAGTGKSTVSNGFLKLFSKQGYTITQCCLSGKASLRLSEINGYPASTIHKLIYSEHNIETDILVIDEASMIGLELFRDLIYKTSPDTKIIIMGDVGQLDSIGLGNIFKDILNSKLFPVVELTQIHRQAQKSAIISDSIKIRHKQNIVNNYFIGEETHGELQDLQIRSYLKPESTFDYVIKDYIDNYKEVGIENIQAVLPMVSRGGSSVYRINNEIQKYVNPQSPSKQEITLQLDKDHKYIIREGDKVMNVTNNYNIEPNIFNGNMGIVQKISKDNMIVDFVGIGIVDIPSDWYNNIILAYASTCHKLQGSEFDIVVVGVDMSAFKLLSNQWIYTAITRAKKKCYLNCQLTALNTAISNMITTNRNTFFKDYDKYLQQGIE